MVTSVLLTGLTGYIGAEVLEQLSEKGYAVVGTVRSVTKAKEYLKIYPNLKLVEVPDITAPNAYDAVIANHPDLSKVIHLASPYRFDVTDPKKELIEPAIAGTTAILNAVHRADKAGKIDRVVITSSFAAVFDNSHTSDPNWTLTEKSWNPVTLEQGYKDVRLGYSVSKKYAEKTAWDFVEKHKPKFQITTICVPMVFGPQINLGVTYDNLNTTMQTLRNFLDSKSQDVPESGIPLYVDVRDAAKAHIAAIERLDQSANKRWLITAGFYTHQDFIDIARQKLPKYATRLPKGTPGAGAKTVANFARYDTVKSNTESGLKYIPFERTVTDTFEFLFKVKDAQKH